jgi:G:T-mismatch repair DNA endonuclease (very short patch repair protein)
MKLTKSVDLDQDARNASIIQQIKEKLLTPDYDYSKVAWDGKMSSKITLICNKHQYEWNPIVRNVISLGCGCIKCGHERRANESRKDFVRESKDKFGEEMFDYSNVDYKSAHQPVKLTCLLHNEEFTCIAREHLINIHGGCSSCCKESSSGANHSLAVPLNEIIRRIQTIWGDRYTYDYTGCDHLNSKIKITCAVHNHTWLSLVANHIHPTNPRGCMACGREATGTKLRMPIEEVIERCKRVHNNTYTYGNINYRGNSINIQVTCQIHGDFPITPAAHWKGYGCPMCSQAGVSKAQLEWLKHIETTAGNDIIYKGGKHNREETFRFNGKLYKVDGFCKDITTIYEFLGCWYHGCPKCQDPDKIHCWKEKSMKELFQEFIDRKKVFEENGYSVVYIWECEWNESIYSEKGSKDTGTTL